MTASYLRAQIALRDAAKAYALADEQAGPVTSELRAQAFQALVSAAESYLKERRGHDIRRDAGEGNNQVKESAEDGIARGREWVKAHSPLHPGAVSEGYGVSAYAAGYEAGLQNLGEQQARVNELIEAARVVTGAVVTGAWGAREVSAAAMYRLHRAVEQLS